MYTLGNFLKKRRRDLFIRGVLGQVDRNENLLSFGINITDIDPTLMREKNPVALQSRD